MHICHNQYLYWLIIYYIYFIFDPLYKKNQLLSTNLKILI